MAALPGPVASLDGEGNVCHWSVRFLLAHDRRGELRYASLQGGRRRSSSIPNPCNR